MYRVYIDPDAKMTEKVYLVFDGYYVDSIKHKDKINKELVIEYIKKTQTKLDSVIKELEKNG